MKIFLFRHGDIVNSNKVFPGRLPGFHLSEAGKEMVRLSAESLKKEKIAKIYTSPLERTVETAQIIADTIGLGRKNVKTNKEIIEVESSFWQGKKYEDFIKNSKYIKNPNITTDMEGRKNSGLRVLNFLKRIAKKNENAVVVSHGDPIMGAIGYITGRWADVDNDDLYIKRGTYYIVEIDGDLWKVNL